MDILYQETYLEAALSYYDPVKLQQTLCYCGVFLGQNNALVGHLH